MGKEAELIFTVPVGMTFWEWGEHEPIIIALFLMIFSGRNWKGPWNISESYWQHGSVRYFKLEFKWSRICGKFRKKAVKGAGIFCGDFWLGHIKYPPCTFLTSTPPTSPPHPPSLCIAHSPRYPQPPPQQSTRG